MTAVPMTEPDESRPGAVDEHRAEEGSADTVAALRSLPDRYREVIRAGTDDEDEEGAVARRPEALEQAARVRDLLDTTARRVERLVEDSRPVTDDVPDGHAPRRGPAQWDPEVVLSVLDTNAERVARLVEGISEASGDRPAVREGLESLTGEIVDEAVNESQLALQETARVIEEDPAP